MGNSHLYKQWTYIHAIRDSRLSFPYAVLAGTHCSGHWNQFYGLGLYDLRIPDDRMGQLSGTFKG